MKARPATNMAAIAHDFDSTRQADVDLDDFASRDFWVAVKAGNLGYYIGEILLIPVYVYTYIYMYYMHIIAT